MTPARRRRAGASLAPVAVFSCLLVLYHDKSPTTLKITTKMPWRNFSARLRGGDNRNRNSGRGENEWLRHHPELREEMEEMYEYFNKTATRFSEDDIPDELRSEHSEGGEFKNLDGSLAHPKWDRQAALYPTNASLFPPKEPDNWRPTIGKPRWSLLYEPLAARYGVMAGGVRRGAKGNKINIKISSSEWDDDTEEMHRKTSLFPGPIPEKPSPEEEIKPSRLDEKEDEFGLDGIAQLFNQEFRENRSVTQDNIIDSVHIHRPRAKACDIIGPPEALSKDRGVRERGMPYAEKRDDALSLGKKEERFNISELAAMRYSLIQMKATQLVADSPELQDDLVRINRELLGKGYEHEEWIMHVQGCRILFDMGLEDLQFERDDALDILTQDHPGLAPILRLRAQNKTRRLWKRIVRSIGREKLIPILVKEPALRAYGIMSDQALYMPHGTFGSGMDYSGDIPPAPNDLPPYRPSLPKGVKTAQLPEPSRKLNFFASKTDYHLESSDVDQFDPPIIPAMQDTEKLEDALKEAREEKVRVGSSPSAEVNEKRRLALLDECEEATPEGSAWAGSKGHPYSALNSMPSPYLP
ncbi:hypothetical protein AAMO2058_001519700 [Amorphochlora amoebiformis]